MQRLNVKELVQYAMLCSLLLLVACQKEELPIASNIEPATSSMEISTVHCTNPSCEDESPLEDLTVELYETLDDAMIGINTLRTGKTNGLGQFRVTGLSVSAVYVRVDHDSYGTYIAYNSIGPDVIAYHQILFVDGFVYDFDDSASIVQSHISFESPIVGQVSEYVYHHSYPASSIGIPTEYEETTLQVFIAEKVDDLSFMVIEYLEKPTDLLSTHYEEESKNLWTFKNDSLIISSLDGDEIRSPLFGLNYYWGVQRLVMPLDFSDDNLLDQEEEIFTFVNWSEATGVIPFELFGQSYENNDVYFDSRAYADGDDIFYIYSKEHGLVRQVAINRYSSKIEGFDLVR